MSYEVNLVKFWPKMLRFRKVTMWNPKVENLSVTFADQIFRICLRRNFNNTQVDSEQKSSFLKGFFATKTERVR